MSRVKMLRFIHIFPSLIAIAFSENSNFSGYKPPHLIGGNRYYRTFYTSTPISGCNSNSCKYLSVAYMLTCARKVWRRGTIGKTEIQNTVRMVHHTLGCFRSMYVCEVCREVKNWAYSCALHTAGV